MGNHRHKTYALVSMAVGHSRQTLWRDGHGHHIEMAQQLLKAVKYYPRAQR
jgi:hypothetical protein